MKTVEEVKTELKQVMAEFFAEVEKLMEEEAEVEGVGLMLADDRILTESGE